MTATIPGEIVMTHKFIDERDAATKTTAIISWAGMIYEIESIEVQDVEVEGGFETYRSTIMYRCNEHNQRLDGVWHNDDFVVDDEDIMMFFHSYLTSDERYH